MLRSCKYCGRIHDSKVVCKEKWTRTYHKKDPSKRAQQIHQSARWKALSPVIRERDTYLCQVCKRRLYDTYMEFNPYTLSVHHIIPIEEDPSLAYERKNLITLCRRHHEMAEQGVIPRETLESIVLEQESGAK